MTIFYSRYFEELQTPNVDKILVKRMENGEQITKMPYGKLMERLDTLGMIKNDDGDSLEFIQKLYPVAEEQLSTFRYICWGELKFLERKFSSHFLRTD